MENFEDMTLEQLIESQIRDDVAYSRQEYHTMLLDAASPEWVDAHIDRDASLSLPVAHLPLEARPRHNGPAREEASGWFNKMRTGTFGQKKGCKTHGMEFWHSPESGSQPYCKKCRAERYYARAAERGAKARDTRRYS